jgi:hypothetical protein
MGFDDEANHSYDLSDIINYKNHEHESFGIKSISNSHKSTEVANHENEMCICDHALPNAPYDYDFSLMGIYLAAVSVTVSEIKGVSGSSLSLLDLREYHAPHVFLSNSSLLL